MTDPTKEPALEPCPPSQVRALAEKLFPPDDDGPITFGQRAAVMMMVDEIERLSRTPAPGGDVARDILADIVERHAAQNADDPEYVRVVCGPARAALATSRTPAGPDALDVLRKCAERFREYEAGHTAKADKWYMGTGGRTEQRNRLEKAARNREMAEMCEAVLAASRTPVSRECPEDGKSVEQAKWLWVNLPTERRWTSLAPSEQALVCHCLVVLAASRGQGEDGLTDEQREEGAAWKRGYSDGIRNAPTAERERIVAWLRTRPAHLAPSVLANAIERGDHLTNEATGRDETPCGSLLADQVPEASADPSSILPSLPRGFKPSALQLEMLTMLARSPDGWFNADSIATECGVDRFRDAVVPALAEMHAMRGYVTMTSNNAGIAFWQITERGVSALGRVKEDG